MNKTKLFSYLDNLGIDKTGKLESDRYVLKLEDSDEYSRYYTILDQEEDLELSDTSSMSQEFATVLTYTSEDYRLKLNANFVDDYYTFLKSQHEFMMRPLFRNTESVKFIKYDKYFMFISVSSKGKYSLLHGARLHSLEYSLEYYYDRLQRYADAVTARFSKYWTAFL